MARTPLVKRLEEIQAQIGESDRQFAARLGIDWSYWSYVRRGERVGGSKLITGACRAFPELLPLIGQEWSKDPVIVDNGPESEAVAV